MSPPVPYLGVLLRPLPEAHHCQPPVRADQRSGKFLARKIMGERRQRMELGETPTPRTTHARCAYSFIRVHAHGYNYCILHASVNLQSRVACARGWVEDADSRRYCSSPRCTGRRSGVRGALSLGRPAAHSLTQARSGRFSPPGAKTTLPAWVWPFGAPSQPALHSQRCTAPSQPALHTHP